MKKWIRFFTSKQFLLFLASGGLAAIVNLGSRIVLNHYLSFTLSVALAYMFGMITAFVLSKLFVFHGASQHSAIRQLAYFTLVNVIAIIQTLIVSIVLRNYFLPFIGWGFHPNEVAHFIGVCVPIFSSYVGHKYVTFSGAKNS
ncbi:GtrA family protein [Paenibacillus sp. KS-LC4]|uniref:GtrA family protein n=1 Tax=Paenibacillus sp. KS-LC4 TaxID=2979727 RepID=UPI0030CC7300